MTQTDRSEMLRQLGLTPTIQRLAVLEFLEGTSSHPTADALLSQIQTKYPTLSRATVYNTLEALTRAGVILRITVDPAAARYDADTGHHAHFRCRTCGQVYDLQALDGSLFVGQIDGHRIEEVRTYAYGVCAACVVGERGGDPSDA